MTTLTHCFDGYLGHFNAEQLKKMVRLWGGTNKLRKDENLALIWQGLNDPAEVRVTLAFPTWSVPRWRCSGVDGGIVCYWLRPAGAASLSCRQPLVSATPDRSRFAFEFLQGCAVELEQFLLTGLLRSVRLGDSFGGNLV